MAQLDRTYCKIIEYITDLSGQINSMCNIQPKIFLRFNQTNTVEGASVLMYRMPDMYIELDIPHNYTFGKKHMTTLTCMFIHEYCHYIDSLSMSGKERSNDMAKYLSNQEYRRLEEQRNWAATKQLAKKLGLWNKLFYKAACECYYTTPLQF